MIKTIYGDVLQIPTIYICHQVNCRGVMGAGLAKQVKEKWPAVYQQYKENCNAMFPEDLLGLNDFIPINDTVCIVNMYAQDKYGKDACYTNYKAFRECLTRIARQADKKTDIIRFPYKIGCGLAGGDWNIIQKLIYEILGDYNVEFYTLDSEPHII